MNSFFDLTKKYYYIIDTSYLIFVCASSAFKEYAFQENVLKSSFSPDFDPTIDPEFNYIFEKRFISKIENSIKSITPLFFNPKNIFFSFDCSRKDIWRRTFFPEYKIKRDTKDNSKDQFNIGKAFNYAYKKIIPDYCDEHESKCIRSDFAESDDIIAVLTKYLLDNDKNNHVIILSSDRDMVQLCNDRTTIVTAQNLIRDPTNEIKTMTKTEKANIEYNAEDFLLFKILIGDSSDNIPGIKPRLGPKTALKYLKNKSALKNLLAEDINIVNSFKRNKQLISMNSIPKEIVSEINKNIKNSVLNNG